MTAADLAAKADLLMRRANSARYDERFVALTGALGADVFPTGGAQ